MSKDTDGPFLFLVGAAAMWIAQKWDNVWFFVIGGCLWFLCVIVTIDK